MEFGILGPLEVRRGGRPVVVGGAKPRAVLAVLLLHANEPVSAERLAVALWGEEAPATGTRTAQVHVSRLRRALGDERERVVSGPAGYCLRVAPGELDRERFTDLAKQGRRALSDGRAEEAAMLLRDALALWRGRPLADLAFAPFARDEVAALEEQRLSALELRLEAEIAMGPGVEVIGELRRLIAEHPLRERLHGQLMLALYRTGRQADALAAYQRARSELVERLGLEPGRELRDLERAILDQDPELTTGPEDRRPASPAAQPPPVRLPRPPTLTIGRELDVARVSEMVLDGATGLVTVTGPGGVGKTRLAIEVARAIGARLSDGAHFVALEGVQSADLVADTIARQLGIRRAHGETLENAVARHLRERRLLLILDNFEHVLRAAGLVAAMLAQTESLTVLATSREPLRLRAERVFRLQPLDVTVGPGDGEDA